MKSYNRITALLALSAVMLFSGCASVPMASPEKDKEAKSFSAPADKSNLYIYRNESMGAAVKMPVAVDGRLVGSTVAKSFIVVSVDPGKHTVLSKTENDATLDVNTEAGKNYFIWQEVKMGVLSARSELQLVAEEVGQKGVSECKLISGD